jgi:beta-glucosidase
MIKLILAITLVITLSSYHVSAHPLLDIPWEPVEKLSDPHWKEMHDKHVAETKTKGKSIQLVFYGDSITEFWINAKDVWNHYYGQRHAVNYGIGRDQTQYLIWRMQNGEINGLNPKVVVLMIGTNNSGKHQSDENIAKGITTIVDILRHRLPHTKVLLLGILPRGDRNTHEISREPHIKNINTIISKHADGKNVVFLDMRSHFIANHTHIKGELYLDGLHLTPKGYQVWAETMEPTLKVMFH